MAQDFILCRLHKCVVLYIAPCAVTTDRQDALPSFFFFYFFFCNRQLRQADRLYQIMITIQPHEHALMESYGTFALGLGNIWWVLAYRIALLVKKKAINSEEKVIRCLTDCAETKEWVCLLFNKSQLSQGTEVHVLKQVSRSHLLMVV